VAGAWDLSFTQAVQMHGLLNYGRAMACSLPVDFELAWLWVQASWFLLASMLWAASTGFFQCCVPVVCQGAKESACGCAGMYSAPVAMALYATAFDQVQNA
jgi:hypothetical protein